MTDADIVARIKSRNNEYWAKRSELRQMKLEGVVSGYEKAIRIAHDDALKAISKDVEGLIEGFRRDMSLNAGFSFTKEQAKSFLEGKVDNAELSRLRRQWGNNGDSLDTVLEKNKYRANELTRKQAIEMSINERMSANALTEQKITELGLADAVQTVHSLHDFDLSVRTGIDLGHRTYTKRDVNAILTNDWSGRNYSSRIWTNTQATADKMKSLFLQHELIGSSTRDIINQLSDATNTSHYESARLIRTEANAMRTISEKTEAEELGIEQYLIVATLDKRTSLICQDMDGKILPWSKSVIGDTAPPFHPNCRTIASDYIDEFMDLSKMKRIARNPETGSTEYVPADMTYKEWKAKHDKETPAEETKPAKAIDAPVKEVKPVERDIYLEKAQSAIDRSKMSEVYGDDNMKVIKDHVNNIQDERVLKMYDKYGDQLKYEKIGNSKGAYFSPWDKVVHLNNDNINGTGKQRQAPVLVVHHEIGHGFDSMGMYDVEGTDRFKVGTKKIKSVISGRFLETDEFIQHVSGLPKYELADTIKQDLWEHVNGDLPTLESLGKKPRKHAEKFEWQEKYSNIYSESKDNFDKFQHETELMLQKQPNKNLRGALSDIAEGTRYMGEYPFGWGHARGYFNDRGQLEAEFFAHMTELRATDPVASKQFDAIFKKSSKIWEQMVDDMLEGSK